MVRAVGFDLDGTLFDDRQYVRAGLQSAAAELERLTGVDLEAAFLEAYFDRGVREETFDVVLAEHDVSLEYVPQLVEAYHENDADLTPYAGTTDVLSTLAESYPLALITGGRNGPAKVSRLGIEQYFDAVVATSDREFDKRDREPFEEVCTRFSVAPDEFAYVGDRPWLDFIQPNRMGMYTVRVASGQYANQEANPTCQPDARVESIRELPTLLAELE